MKKNKKNKRGLKVDLKVFRVLNRLWSLEQAVCTLNNRCNRLFSIAEGQAVMQSTDRLVYASAADMIRLKMRLLEIEKTLL